MIINSKILMKSTLNVSYQLTPYALMPSVSSSIFPNGLRHCCRFSDDVGSVFPFGASKFLIPFSISVALKTKVI